MVWDSQPDQLICKKKRSAPRSQSLQIRPKSESEFQKQGGVSIRPSQGGPQPIVTSGIFQPICFGFFTSKTIWGATTGVFPMQLWAPEIDWPTHAEGISYIKGTPYLWHHKTHNQNPPTQNPHKGHDSYQCIRGLLWKGSGKPWLNQMGVEYQPVDVLSFHQQKTGCFISFTSKSTIKSPSSGTCTIRFTFSFFGRAFRHRKNWILDHCSVVTCFFPPCGLGRVGVLMRRCLGSIERTVQFISGLQAFRGNTHAWKTLTICLNFFLLFLSHSSKRTPTYPVEPYTHRQAPRTSQMKGIPS